MKLIWKRIAALALCGCMIFGNSAYAAEIERETITVEMETPNDDQQSEEKEESDSNELPAGEDEPEKLEDESEKPEDEENLEDQADPEEKDDSEEKDDQNDADQAEEGSDDNTGEKKEGLSDEIESEEIGEQDNSLVEMSEDIAPFNFVVNGEEITDYTNIIDAVASLQQEDVAELTLTNDIVLPQSTPITLTKGTLTIDLADHLLTGEDCPLEYPSGSDSSWRQESIIYMPADNTAVLNIVGDGEIRSRNISDKRVKAYAINAGTGSTINHKSGKISGFYGVNVDTGNLTCSGKYEVSCQAIYASGVIYIDGADVVVNAKNNPSSVLTIGISVHPFDQECYIKNTKVRMNVSGEGESYLDGGTGITTNTGWKASCNMENVDVEVVIEGEPNVASIYAIAAGAYGKETYIRNVNVTVQASDQVITNGFGLTNNQSEKLIIDGVNVQMDNICGDCDAFVVCGPKFGSYAVRENQKISVSNVHINVNVGDKSKYDTINLMTVFGDVSNCEVKARGNANGGKIYGFVSPRVSDWNNLGIESVSTTLKDFTIDLYATGGQTREVCGVLLKGDEQAAILHTVFDDGVEIKTGGNAAVLQAVGFGMYSDEQQYIHYNLADGCRWVDENGNTISNEDVTKVKYARSTNGKNERYTIEYVLNGGTNNLSNPGKYKNSEIISFADAVREGYEFGGWYTDAALADDSRITTTENQVGNLVLYAKWIPHTYRLIFDANFPMESVKEGQTGYMEEQEISVGSEIPISLNKYACTGYRFKGWNTNVDGSGVSYSDGQKIKDLSLIDGQAITLYATWEKEKLTGITINPTAVKLAAGESAQIYVAPQPANALFETPTFRSSNEKIATVDSMGKISAVAKGTAKITVKVNSYTKTCTVTVTDIVKTPKASVAGGEVAKNTQITLTSETAGAVIYYTLDGTDPTAKSTKYTAPIQITKDTTIRAIATKSGYLDSEIAEFIYFIPGVTVTFDTDGGKPESEPQTLRKGDYLNMYHVMEPEKEGYHFEGWYVGEKKLDPTKAVNESMTVKARWSEAEKLSVPEANYPNGKSLPVDAEVILTAKKGTNIYYTLDGSTPTKESHLYQGPVVLAEDLWKDGAITIKAVASGSGYRSSETAVYQYQLTEEPAGYGEIEVRDIPQGEISEGMWIAGLEESYTYTGKAIKPEIRVYDHKRKLALNKDYSISYKNNTNAGEAQIIITGKGNYTSKIIQSFVIGQKSLEDGDITAADLTVVGNNKVQKKAPVVQWNGKKLSANKEYTVSYEEDDADAFKAPGKYRIIITGKGNYTGSITVIETITDAKSDKLLEKMKFSSVKAQTYTGEEICPEITVTDKKTVLIEGTDYEAEYRNNVAVGTATIVLRGLGDYKGEKQITFKINGTAMNKTAVNGMKNLTYEAGRNVYEQEGLQLTFKKSKTETITLPEDAYEVSYTNNTKVGTATVIFTGIPEKGYTGSIKKTFKILASDSISGAEILYDQEVSYSKGGAKPAVTVKMGATVLIPDVDYTVSYKNNTKLHDGEAKNAPMITIKGKGNYKGQTTRTFAIVPKAAGELTATAEDLVFSNKKNNYVTKVTIVDTDGKKLAAGTDYDKNLTYYAGERKIEKNEILPVGTEITVKTEGKGNYQGEICATYRIGEKKFSSVKITIPNQTYTGEEVTLEKKDLTITYKEGKETRTLTEAEYEIVDYQNNVKKGTAKVTVKGLGAYAGTKTVTFKIEAKNIEKR